MTILQDIYLDSVMWSFWDLVSGDSSSSGGLQHTETASKALKLQELESEMSDLSHWEPNSHGSPIVILIASFGTSLSHVLVRDYG